MAKKKKRDKAIEAIEALAIEAYYDELPDEGAVGKAEKEARDRAASKLLQRLISAGLDVALLGKAARKFITAGAKKSRQGNRDFLSLEPRQLRIAGLDLLTMETKAGDELIYVKTRYARPEHVFGAADLDEERLEKEIRTRRKNQEQMRDHARRMLQNEFELMEDYVKACESLSDDDVIDVEPPAGWGEEDDE